MKKKKYGIVTTGSEVFKGRIKDTFSPVIREKLAEFPSEEIDQIYVDDEKEHILEALRQTGNNKSKAAQLLNIDRKTLYNKLKLYNIDL